MPEVAETTAAANATSSSVPVVFSPGDVVALSISVVAAAFLAASFWCARRKLSARAVRGLHGVPGAGAASGSYSTALKII